MMDKTAIKNFAIEARRILRESAIKKAGMYGITIDECSKPIQRGTDFEVYKTIAGDEIRLYGKESKMRSSLVNAIKEKGFEQVIEETAYTWFNRLIAIRFMEVNDYLPTRVRVLSSETGNSTPDIVTHFLDVDLDFDSTELDKIQKAKDDNRFDEAFQLLFIKQCNELNKILPGLFEETNDYMELLLAISYTSDGVVRMLVDDIPEADFNVEREGQIEIIGWLYQYYNTELKDDTFAKLKKNIKITKERIPAATQLFTPDWIVRYMVENSLGRVWIEHLRAVDESQDEKALAESFGWKYYLPEAEQEESVATELIRIRAERKELKPQDLSCIDPCCGSGHILVYMFDVLLQIYESEGISVRDAVFDILEKNIHGLDIDMRAYQLSYFALMMKGRGAAGRRFFRGVETDEGVNRPVELNVFAIDESNDIDRNSLQFLGKGLTENEKNTAEMQANRFLEEMKDAKEYGSIINVTESDWGLIDKYLDSAYEDGQMTLNYMGAIEDIVHIKKLFSIGKIISKQYYTTITNPPYMGLSNGTALINNYVKKFYPNSKADLSTVFMERNISYTKSNGYISMINIPVWMSLTGYKKMRVDLLRNSSFINLLHLGRGIFGSDFGTVSFTVKKNNINNYIAVYKRLFEKSSMVDSADTKEKWFFDGDRNFYKDQKEFKKIPGNPIAYWISSSMIDVFMSDKLGDIGTSSKGIITGDNARFLRLWQEVAYEDIKFDSTSSSDSESSDQKWYPCRKGGSARKWYGNNEYIINWKHNGFEVIKCAKNEKRNCQDYSDQFKFIPSITWTSVTIGDPTFRYGSNDLAESAGMSFFTNEERLYYVLGFLNSSVAKTILKVLSPTVNYTAGAINSLPIIFDYDYFDKITALVKENIKLSKTDWDSYETSWDFEMHPLVRIGLKNGVSLREAYKEWDLLCQERFNRIKQNEIQIDDAFSRIYRVDNNSNITDSDITIGKAELSRDIKSLIAYSVGCMFGRYSLDRGGLVSAGGNFNRKNYVTFPADDDAIIPITDEEYFDDDIVKRFEEFISVVFDENSLVDNLKFIAEVLDNNNDSYREVIRNYFISKFFDNHCNTYSVNGSGKRPIYWLFDSGKENGFKCLIYLHRYTPDTVGLIRSVYLKKAQDAIETSLKNAEYVIANSESAVDRADSTKKRDKYVKQLAEIKPYYQALSHVAMQRIEIDLDDGVKVNYAKFQNIEVGGEGEKKQTINLLAKI